MKKSILIKIVLIIVLALITNYANNVYAAGNYSISASSTTVTVGDTVTISVTGSDAYGKVNISSSSGSLSSSSVFLENNTKTVTLTTSQTGTITVTASPSAEGLGDSDENPITGNRMVNITVKAKPTPTPVSTPTPTTSSGGNTTSKPTPTPKPTVTPTPTAKEPKFVNKSITMIAKQDFNLRDSWIASGNKTPVKEGTEISVIAVSNEIVNDHVWYKVSYEGKTKYAASEFLIEKTEEVTEESEETPVEEENIEVTSEKIFGLESIKINSEELKDFKVDEYHYKYDIKNVDKLDIVAIANEEGAIVEILGNENFHDGENTVTIIVVSKDGERTATYQIEVNKSTEIIGKLNLKNLLIYAGLAFVILVALITLIVTLIKSNKSIEDDEYDPEEINNNNDMEIAEEIIPEINEETQDVISDYKTRRKGGKHSK